MRINPSWLVDRLYQCLESEDIHAEVESLIGNVVERQIKWQMLRLPEAERRQVLLKLKEGLNK